MQQRARSLAAARCVHVFNWELRMPFDLPPVTRALLVANAAVFLLQQLFGSFLLLHFALWPLGSDQLLGYLADGSLLSVGFRPWQLVSYGFMHGGITHIFFNMFALFMFGGAIERLLGKREFLIYYFVCLVVAAMAQLLVVKFFTGGFYPTVGASGAVFGLLLAFAMFFPEERLMLIFLPVPIPARWFVGGYVAIELILGVTRTQSGVAHFAHLGGALAGFVLIQFWRGRLPIKPRRRLMR